MLEVGREYPELVRECLESYDNAICTYLGVAEPPVVSSCLANSGCPTLLLCCMRACLLFTTLYIETQEEDQRLQNLFRWVMLFQHTEVRE